MVVAGIVGAELTQCYKLWLQFAYSTEEQDCCNRRDSVRCVFFRCMLQRTEEMHGTPLTKVY